MTENDDNDDSVELEVLQDISPKMPAGVIYMRFGIKGSLGAVIAAASITTSGIKNEGVFIHSLNKPEEGKVLGVSSEDLEDSKIGADPIMGGKATYIFRTSMDARKMIEDGGSRRVLQVLEEIYMDFFFGPAKANEAEPT